MKKQQKSSSETMYTAAKGQMFLLVPAKSGGSLGNTVDSAYNIHGYKGQPVIVATKIMPQNPH